MKYRIFVSNKEEYLHVLNILQATGKGFSWPCHPFNLLTDANYVDRTVWIIIEITSDGPVIRYSKSGAFSRYIPVALEDFLKMSSNEP